MAREKVKRVEFEREKGERFDTLHFRLRVPKLGLPEETGSHVKSAEREMLLALRTLVDELVERLGAGRRQGKGGKASTENREGQG